MTYARKFSVVMMGLLICGSAATAGAQPGNYKIVDLGFGNAAVCAQTPINSAGQAILSANDNGTGPSHAFLVDANGTRIDMGTLFGHGTEATFINSSGQVLGISAVDTIESQWHSFFWSQETGIVDLTPSSTSSNACAMNNRGDIVGRLNGHATIWMQGTPYALDSLNIEGLSNWSGLTTAAGINDSGEIIGGGNVGTSPHVFLLVPTASSGGPTPFSGSPVSVPGRILASDFDNGGEGVAYHDTTAGNTGGAFRNTDVDLEASSEGGNDVGWIDAGEWLNYTVNVAASGDYTVQLRVASPSGASLHVGFNGPSEGQWKSVSVPATGDWQNWTTVNVPVTLGAGVQQMTLLFDTPGVNVLWADVGH
jgi:hypothetical protein